MSFQRSPNTSPRRNPELAATRIGPAASGVHAATTASTCSRVGGSICRGGRPTRGRRSATFSRTSPSSTAVESIARSGASVFRTVFADAPAAARREANSAVTDAGSQSRPILARMGFRELFTIRALIDRFE